jgi:hypothetical protein
MYKSGQSSLRRLWGSFCANVTPLQSVLAATDAKQTVAHLLDLSLYRREEEGLPQSVHGSKRLIND